MEKFPEETNFSDRTKKSIQLFHEISMGAQKFHWRIAFLSGFAIDAHFGYLTKNHKDVDVMVSRKQASEISEYLKQLGHTVYEAEKFKGECLKVDQVDPEKPTQAHCDIHYFWEENNAIVIPLLGKKLIFSASFDESTEKKVFLGENITVLKLKYLLEEKVGWCEQIGLSQCREKPEEYNADLEKIHFLQGE